MGHEAEEAAAVGREKAAADRTGIRPLEPLPKPPRTPLCSRWLAPIVRLRSARGRLETGCATGLVVALFGDESYSYYLICSYLYSCYLTLSHRSMRTILTLMATIDDDVEAGDDDDVVSLSTSTLKQKHLYSLLSLSLYFSVFYEI